MRKITKTLFAAGVLACGLASALPAQAAVAAVDPVGVCGSGFRVIDSHPFKSGSTALGTIYLSYNSGTGKNCVVTVNKTPYTRWMRATLTVQGGATKTDAGEFKSYAGPVILSAVDTCVKWGGAWDESPYVWTSGWSHCG
ncbi:spore-associated protein A [Nonomuraea sp. NPDC049646]|uniref:spore-associated protein A n=1 Tax=unclassified Nonomuraea TaxID=2593643 RepID=UPI0037B9A0FD